MPIFPIQCPNAWYVSKAGPTKTLHVFFEILSPLVLPKLVAANFPGGRCSQPPKPSLDRSPVGPPRSKCGCKRRRTCPSLWRAWPKLISATFTNLRRLVRPRDPSVCFLPMRQFEWNASIQIEFKLIGVFKSCVLISRPSHSCFFWIQPRGLTESPCFPFEQWNKEDNSEGTRKRSNGDRSV